MDFNLWMYVHAHIWEWGVVRKREGLGGAERDCPHVHEIAHHHFQIRRSQERKLLYRSLKNISHAIFVWKTQQQKKPLSPKTMRLVSKI